MPKFCANLSMLFTELPFLDRFQAAAEAGFKGVEYLFPYDYSQGELTVRLKDNGLTQVLFNMAGGNRAEGEMGISALPARVAEFREDLARAAEYALALGCKQVHCMAGTPPPDCAPAKAHETYVANLRFAAAEFHGHDLRVLIEPINTRDRPGYFLNRSQQALDIIAEVGAPNLRLQYDVYHMQIMEGDLTPTIEKHLASVAHVQVADNPGRHEPGTGEINFPFIFSTLDRLGYDGWIGCEYSPLSGTRESLDWFAPYT